MDTLLSLAIYSDTIFCSGAVLSSENAGGDTGATAEVVTIIYSLQKPRPAYAARGLAPTSQLQGLLHGDKLADETAAAAGAD